MKKNSNMAGMILGLIISLIIVPFIGLAAFNTSAALGAKSEVMTTASKLEAYADSLYGNAGSTESLERTSGSYNRTETAQDILRDYQTYLDSQK